jgi:hypothetical protein
VAAVRIMFSLMSTLCVCFCAALFSGCGEQARKPPGGTAAAASGENPPREIKALALNIASAAPAKYEPKSGCYLGVYALSDAALGDGGFGFDAAAQKAHAAYTRHVISGEAVPEDWLLACLARRKTPIVTVQPPLSGDAYGAAAFAETAKSLGAFDVPAFVNIYPYSAAKKFDKDKYTAFWREAAALIKLHAPRAALVWSVSAGGGLAEAGAYLPADADWLGFELFADAVNGGLDESGFDKLDEFYKTYQSEKPIILFAAVSHFSAAGSRYYAGEASAAIQRVYDASEKDYPRIKAVVYMNYNAAGIHGKDDYTVTGDDAARAAYREAVSRRWFLSSVEREPGGYAAAVRAALPALVIDGEIFLPGMSLKAALIPLPEGGGESVSGEAYFPVADVNAASPIDFYISDDGSQITVERRTYGESSRGAEGGPRQP